MDDFCKRDDGKMIKLMVSIGGKTVINTEVPDDYTIHDTLIVLKKPGVGEEKDKIIAVK